VLKSLERIYFRFNFWYASSEILRDEIHFMGFLTRITFIINIIFLLWSCFKIWIQPHNWISGSIGDFLISRWPIPSRATILVNTFETNAQLTENSFSCFVAKRTSLYIIGTACFKIYHTILTELQQDRGAWVSGLIKQIYDDILWIIQSFFKCFVFLL